MSAQETMTLLPPVTLTLRERVDFTTFETIDVHCEVTPVVVWSHPIVPPSVGLLIHPPDGEITGHDLFRTKRGFYLSSTMSLNFITFWRAAHLLRACTVVDDILVQRSFNLVTDGIDSLPPQSQATLEASVRGGRDEIVRMCTLTPPAWLVERMLRLWKARPSDARPEFLTEEVRAGRLLWDERFREVGVLTPEELDQQNQLWQEVSYEMGPHMRSCRKVLQEPLSEYQWRKPLLMLAGTTVRDVHGKAVLAALASAAALAPSIDILADASIITGINPWHSAASFDREVQWALKQLAPWVAKRLRGSEPFDPSQVREAHHLLMRLYAEYFPLTHVAHLKQLELALS